MPTYLVIVLRFDFGSEDDDDDAAAVVARVIPFGFTLPSVPSSVSAEE